MSRQDANAAFALTSFLYGGNAAYIDDLYARYEADPKAVDAEWQAFFQSLKDDAGDVAKNAHGPSGGGPTGRRPSAAISSPRSTAIGPKPRRRVGAKVKAQAQARGVDIRAERRARDPRLDPRADADPRLSRARPLPRQSRSARARAAEERGGTRSAHLRLRRRRSRPPDFPRQGARPRIRHRAPDRRHPAPHLLPDARRRIPAHLQRRAEGLDPGAHRRARQGDHVHPRGQARHPQQAGRSRRLREILRPEIHRHQALRPRRRASR